MSLKTWCDRKEAHLSGLRRFSETYASIAMNNNLQEKVYTYGISVLIAYIAISYVFDYHVWLILFKHFLNYDFKSGYPPGDVYPMLILGWAIKTVLFAVFCAVAGQSHRVMASSGKRLFLTIIVGCGKLFLLMLPALYIRTIYGIFITSPFDSSVSAIYHIALTILALSVITRDSGPTIRTGDKCLIAIANISFPLAVNLLLWIEPPMSDGLREYISIKDVQILTTWSKFYFSVVNALIVYSLTRAHAKEESTTPLQTGRPSGRPVSNNTE